MNRLNDIKKRANILRKRAEEKIIARKEELESIPGTHIREFIHELWVHEAELEMQNEELLNTQVELEESRSKYFELYDLAPVGYVSLDHRQIIQNVNLTFTGFLGIPRTELNNTPFISYIHNDDRVHFYSHLRKASRSDREESCEVKLNWKNNDKIYAQLISRSTTDSSGQTSYRMVIIDITERKSLEKQLEQQLGKLKLANDVLKQEIADHKITEKKLINAKIESETAIKAKDSFINYINNLLTPIYGILGMAELVLSSNINSDKAENLDMLMESADILLALIKDVINFSDVESNKRIVHPVEFSLCDSLDQIRQFFATMVKKDKIILTSKISPDIPFTIMADKSLLEQIMYTLVSNAIKFTDGGKILIQASQQDDNKENQITIEISIYDTGMVIPADMEEEIFKAFSQLNSLPSKAYSGSVTGLALAKKYIELMGGNLRFERNPESGSAFHFTFRAGLAG